MKNLQQLVRDMTLDEKIAQLIQLATPFFKGSTDQGEITGPMKEMGVSPKIIENAGSVLGASGAENIKAIQKQHLMDNRLGIPLLFMSDIVHGYKTIFPIPLAIGCSWDLELAEKSAQIAALEASVSGIHVTFAPMVDLVRDPRWGRVMESTGEDPYLNSEFARAQVRGFQGSDLANEPERVAACVKHFAAYGAPEGGRDYNTVTMSERDMRESYLPAYKAALDEGCEMVMSAFNTVDGIPATGNKKLMRDILRGEMDFDGVLISDWGAVKEMIPHGIAEDEAAAALKAIQAGIDIEMMTTCYVDHLKSFVDSGDLDEGIIDEAVLRILKLKEKLGLFDNPYRGADELLEKELVMSENHRKVSRELAVKSAVLLKNSGNILPLDKGSKIALTGPLADSGDILGAWSWQGSKEDAVTLKEGILQKIDPSLLSAASGSSIEAISQEDSAAAVKSAEEADVILLALGESSGMSGEAGSRSNIKLPEAQLKLFRELKKTGKPIVVILFNGRPLDLTDISGEADAILEAWQPGTEGGAAIAEILYGDENPSGKLTMSFPYTAGQVPVYYNHYNTGRPKDAPDAQERYVSQYLDIPNKPLFPFGYGLSYTTYSYKKINISADTLVKGDKLTVSAEITNTGSTAGEEIVQFYIRDAVGEVVRPLKELKGFKRIALEPGETKRAEFSISEEQLRYHHADLSFKSDNGQFFAYIGSSSDEVMTIPFKLQS
ncbi:glycosyl hydrolase, family 3 [Bacillus sp. NRRL B-14911]|uniref:beta-glucosidase n=1 Tax=Bacillus infantis NRRL B-14911 TaxID=1367477 RepID=U5L6I3_9BACI|nr:MULTISPECIES: glycoside hydrolase family 3 N-terminal domain-containing protein [Bacillus]AGX02978.1 glycosyl hydrolase family 3 [Bacillus infantis NRRL B-14911]EAR64462.1 glycosyl hydrolase, family 3 [Bacillus sp. NRRL B-14911]